MTIERATSSNRRKRRRLLRPALAVLFVVLIGGVIADRVIVAHINDDSAQAAPQARALPGIFARSPAGGKDVTMPIEPPALLAASNRNTDQAPRGNIVKPKREAKKSPPRRWFVEPGDQPIDALAQSPVSLAEDWYSGFARPSAGIKRLRKGEPQELDPNAELDITKRLRMDAKKK